MSGSKVQIGQLDNNGAVIVPRPANLLRVMAAVCYDTLLCLTLWFLATAFILLFTHGQAIRSGDTLYDAYLLAVLFPYFAYSWMHGQTLGMRAWKLHIRNTNGALPNLRQCLIRYLTALVSWFFLGLGFLWIGIDRQQLSWHDRVSATRLLRRP